MVSAPGAAASPGGAPSTRARGAGAHRWETRHWLMLLLLDIYSMPAAADAYAKWVAETAGDWMASEAGRQR